MESQFQSMEGVALSAKLVSNQLYFIVFPCNIVRGEGWGRGT